MKVLLKQATIIEDDTNTVKDILIENGIIKDIQDLIVSDAEVVMSSNKLFVLQAVKL